MNLLRGRAFKLEGPTQVKLFRALLIVLQYVFLLAMFMIGSVVAMWCCEDVPYVQQWGWGDWFSVAVSVWLLGIAVRAGMEAAKELRRVTDKLGEALDNHKLVKEGIKRGDKAIFNSKGDLIYRVGKDDNPL